jgi:copper-exporting ATPase
MEQPHAVDPAWIAVILSGSPILYTALHSLLCLRKIHAELLVSAALIGTLTVGEYLAAGGIALIMYVGTMLEDQIILHTHHRISALCSQKNMNAGMHSIDTHDVSMVQTAKRRASQLILLAFVLAGAVWWTTNDVDRAVTALVVFCPCAFVHAAPMAVSAAVGSLAQQGILLRTSHALERLSHMENAVFTLDAIAPAGYLDADAGAGGGQPTRPGGGPGRASPRRAGGGMGMHPVLLGSVDAHTAQIAKQVGIRDVRTALPPSNDPFTAWTALIRRETDTCAAGLTHCLHITIGSTSDKTDADVVCAAADLSRLPALLLTARRIRQNIEQNTLFGLTLNFIALGLAACGYLSPLAGAVWHNAAAIFIVLNAALLTASADREKKFAFSTSL